MPRLNSLRTQRRWCQSREVGELDCGAIRRLAKTAQRNHGDGEVSHTVGSRELHGMGI